ncbi:MAG: anti-sigma F factor [Peptostreptococcales bacterium]
MSIIKNCMKLEFLSKSENESFARVAVSSFVSQVDPTIEELVEIKTALSEAVTNSIIHAYNNEEGIVCIECSIENNIIEIIIKDKGKGIEDIHKAMEPLYTSKPEEERSGMGFTVMETFVDEMKVESELGKGTKVTLKKVIAKTIEQ